MSEEKNSMDDSLELRRTASNLNKQIDSFEALQETDPKMKKGWRSEYAKKMYDDEWRKVNEAMIDSLTGLYSRRYFDETLSKEIAQAEREDMPLVLVFVDYDNFKGVNDKKGHIEADGLLKKAGNFWVKKVREGDIVCRYAGDEMVIIMPNTSIESVDLKEGGKKGLEDRVNEIREEWNKGLEEKNRENKFGTMSIGIGVYTSGMTAEELIEAADKAMYKVKHRGGDGVANSLE